MRCFLASLALLTAIAQARAEDRPRQPWMTVPASASAEVVPDIANLTLGAVTERATASEAAAANAHAAQRLIDQVRAQGIEPRDIRTVSVTLTPRHGERREPDGRISRGPLLGYVARNIVAVRVHSTEKAGAIARGMIDKGANSFQGVDFTISNVEDRLDELRAQAIREAVRKAGLYSEAAGVKLGRIISIEPEPLSDSGADMATRRLSNESTSVPVPLQPGIQTISAQVKVTWALEP